MANPLTSKSSPHCCGASHDGAAAGEPSLSRLIVTGHPNVGKSVIFQWLTGRYSTVSNYPGTTVMISEGKAVLRGQAMRVHDTPGIYSLMAASEDELISRRLLLSDGPAVVLQVADAKTLDRALSLTVELAEAGIPMVLAVNMIDEARERRIRIDAERLRERLGVPVVLTIATQRWGFDRLARAIPDAAVARLNPQYAPDIEQAARQIEEALPASMPGRRAWALLWLAGEPEARQRCGEAVPEAAFTRLAGIVDGLRARHASLEGSISKARMRHARTVASECWVRHPESSRPWLLALGDVLLHPVWGGVAAAAVVGLMYQFVGVFGAQTAVGFLEETVFGAWLNPLVTSAVAATVPFAWLRDLLVGPYGLITMALTYAVAIILPIVGTFFLFFGLLEDVGYLPRLAVMADRLLRGVGLSGKAVLPLVLGLGCGTMATMASRTLETKRDQILVTLLLALAVPCSAQLGVIMAMFAGLPWTAVAIWAGVILLSFVGAGQLAGRLVPGDPSPFIFELPPLRRPQLSNVVIKTLGRVEWYVREAVPLFFLGTFVLFVLDRTGALVWIERAAAPFVVHWLGLPIRATEALLVGFLRRDFGAAGFFALRQDGLLDDRQTVVSLVTITLFIPCLAQYLMMIKERGWKLATLVGVLVIGYAMLMGGAVRWGLQHLAIL